MGIIDSIEFHTKKLSVNGDDFIIMVTDGIMDAKGGKWKARVDSGPFKRNRQSES